jgi:hypothetical protein
LKLIKVLNPDKAQELIKSGFKYTTENFNGKTIYVFMLDDKLVKYVQKSFAKNDYFIDRTMNF